MRKAAASLRRSWTRILGGAVLAALAAPLPAAPIDGNPADVPAADLSAPLEASRELPRSRPAVTLFVFDIKGLIGERLPVFAGEAGAIFKEMGVELGWKSSGLGTVFGAGEGREIPIIVLDKPSNAMAVGPAVLGLVPKEGRTAVWVFLEHIQRAAGIRPDGLLRPDSSRQLAVAAGRVVAHELVHALVPTLHHTRTGLMRSSLDKAALVGYARPSLADCASAVRTALAPASVLLQRPALVAGVREQVAY